MQIPNIIDIEASGFGKDSYPIEVGFITTEGLCWCTLIKPEAEWLHWNTQAEAVHQLSRDLLFKHGRSAYSVAEELNVKFRHGVVYSDAWGHDYVWMARLFEVANLSPRFQLKDLREILSQQQLENWDITKANIISDLNLKRHRASSDAKILQLTWIRTWEMQCVSRG